MISLTVYIEAGWDSWNKTWFEYTSFWNDINGDRDDITSYDKVAFN